MQGTQLKLINYHNLYQCLCCNGMEEYS